MPRSKVAMAIGGRFIARDACGYVESSEIPKKDDTGSISSLFYVHTNLLFVGLTIYLYIYVYTSSLVPNQKQIQLLYVIIHPHEFGTMMDFCFWFPFLPW
jgi:hypothetical protein